MIKNRAHYKPKSERKRCLRLFFIICWQQLILIEMETVQDLVTDKQIDLAWGNANFGGTHTKRDIIANALLKCASGYHTGHTAKCIVEELGLVTQKWELSQRGKRYLFAAYSGGLSL